MRKLALILSLLMCLGLEAIFAQTRNISGTVTGKDDGQPIPGASVSVKGTTTGTITRIDGKYDLAVPADATTLVFSFVGMTTQEVAIAGKSVINAVMETESIGVDEVVVTALGIRRSEKSLGYSATSVNSAEITKTNNENAMNSLAGKVAGLVVTGGGGQPGASTKVILRGYSNINGSNSPLYVIDGMPVTDDTRTNSTSGLDFGNRANDINPNDIESMSVLKGAAATALYGSRAGNGVIMITTKSGKKGDKVRFEYSGSMALSEPLRLPQMQNTFGQGWSGVWKDDENGSWGPKMDGQMRLWGNIYNNSQQLKAFEAQENNLRDFYDYGVTYNNSVSVTGGSEKSNFFMSLANVSADGMLPSDVDSNQRNTFKVSGSTEGKILKASGNLNYVRRDGSSLPDGRGGSNTAANLYSEILQIPRDISIVDMKDYKNNPFNTLDYYFTPYAFNPYYAMEQNQSEFNEDRVYGNMDLKFTITNDLNVVYRLGTDVSSFQRKDHEAIMRFTPGTPQANKKVSENPGSVYEQSIKTKELNSDLMVNYKAPVGDDFSLDAMGGFSIYSRDYKALDGSIASLVIPGYYNLSNTSGTPTTTTFESQKRMTGLYGQLNFGYKNYLFLNATARNDWSSTLPEGNNSYFYPAANISFIPTELLNIGGDVLDFAKIRASIGQSGSDADPYSVYSVFIPAEVGLQFGSIKFPIDGAAGFEKSNQIGNLNLKPVISTEWEIGLDARFFNGRAMIDIAYYNKLSDGQILPAPISPSSGYTTQIINFGKIENKGIELLLDLVPVKTRDFAWNLAITYTNNNNKVLTLPGTDEMRLTGAYDVDFVAIKGQPLGVFKAPDYLRDAEGHVVVNASNGIPIAGTTPTVVGNAQNKYLVGLTNKFTYKGLEMGFGLDIRQGGKMYSGTADLHYFVGNATQTIYNDRQPFIVPNSVKENPFYDATDPESSKYIENDVAVDMNNTNAYYYTSQNDIANRWRVIDRSFVKLRELYLTYRIPNSIVQKAKLQGASVTLAGRNLILWTPEENNFIDPEVTSYGNDLRGDFGEFRTGPTARTVSVGLNLTF